MLLILVVIFFGDCNAQSKPVHNRKNDIPSRLNMQRYQGKETGKDNFRLISNDTTYDLFKRHDSYVETIKVKGKAIKKVNRYDLNSLQILSESYDLAYCPVGIYRSFDSNGKVLRKIDFDADYKFSTNQLIKKLETDFGIDPASEDKVLLITRAVDEEDGVRKIFIRDYKSDFIYRSIILHGDTGAVLEDKERFMGM